MIAGPPAGEPVMLDGEKTQKGSDMNFRRAYLISLEIIVLTLLSVALIQVGDAQPLATQNKSKVLPPQKKQLNKLQTAQDTALSHAAKAKAAKGAATESTQQPRITIRAGRSAARIGDVVSFEIKHTFPRIPPTYQYSIYYSDGPPEFLPLTTTTAYHMFRSAGPFTVIASIVSVSPAMMISHFSPIRDSVVVKVDGFSISVVPEVARVGENVRFIVPVDDDGGRMYRFCIREIAFVSPWNTSPEYRHIFEKPGSYTIFAEIGRESQDSKKLSGRVVSVAETPQREFRVLPQIPKTVVLQPDLKKVTVGTPVVFTASVDPPSDQVRYRFNFDDGDSSEWQASASARHTYKSTRKYMVTVDAYYQEVFLTSKPVLIVVNPGEPPPPRMVALRANRPDVLVDTPVTFIATVDHPSNNVNYRFIFGDGETSQWQEAGSATHKYNGAGQFMASVEASFKASYAHDILKSETIPIRVSRILPPLWVWIAAGFVLSAAIGFGVRPVREWIFGPRVTILVKSDKGPPTIKSLTPPTIDVRVILRSKARDGRFALTPKDNVLIKSIRRKHA